MIPKEATARCIRELRKRHGWTQQDLADRLNNQLGARTDRAAVAKTELGQRGLSLEEAFLYALALDVAPVHLFVPTDSDEPIQIGPNLEVSPAEMRAWIRGTMPVYPVQDPRAYFMTVPREEFERRAQSEHEAGAGGGEGSTPGAEG